MHCHIQCQSQVGAKGNKGHFWSSKQQPKFCNPANKEKYRHIHTQQFNGLWSGTTRVGWFKKKHPLTPILIIGHPLSSSSIYNDQWHPLCSFYVLDSPLVQPLSREIQNTRKNIPHVPLCGGNNNKLQPSQS